MFKNVKAKHGLSKKVKLEQLVSQNERPKTGMMRGERERKKKRKRKRRRREEEQAKPSSKKVWKYDLYDGSMEF